MEIEKEFTKCQICSRILKNPKYRLLGFGPICYKKHLAEIHTRSHKLFELEKK